MANVFYTLTLDDAKELGIVDASGDSQPYTCTEDDIREAGGVSAVTFEDARCHAADMGCECVVIDLQGDSHYVDATECSLAPVSDLRLDTWCPHCGRADGKHDNGYSCS